MDRLLKAIVDDDRSIIRTLLKSNASLATQTASEARLYESGIFHWLYVGDTALHLAAAGYRTEVAQLLLAVGAQVNALNRRHATPLHYASDGYVTGPAWDPERQVKTIHCLLKAGADIDLPDKNGATALHRAVRTRCAAAVRYLLSAGANPRRRNNTGSTPFHLAVQNTGRGGSGEQMAKNAQRQIIEAFLAAGVSPDLKDANGKSVTAWAKSDWILQLLG